MAEVRLFIQRYARKARPGGHDPNDRDYDRRVEAAVKRMRPEQLDALLRDGEDAAMPQSAVPQRVLSPRQS